MLRLVLLPGMNGTGKLFARFVEALPASFDAVTVRYPADLRLSYLDLERFVRDACSGDEPFLLVAESFSTPLAIRCAATHPANLQGLVLCAGFATSPVAGWRRLVAWLLAPILFRLPLTDFAMKLWLVGPDASPSLLGAVRAAISGVLPTVLSARLRAVLACDVRRELSQVRVPILYMQASRDRLVAASCLEEVGQARPEVTVAVLDGPHLILQLRPEQAAEVVRKFAEQR